MNKLIRIILLLSLTTLLLVAARQGPSQHSAWFNNQTQRQPAAVGQTIHLSVFPDQIGTLYALQPDGLFTTSYAGLVTLSGHCSVKNNGTWLLRLHISDVWIPELANTSAKSASFTYTFPAVPVYLTFSHDNPTTANGALCSLLFEKVR